MRHSLSTGVLLLAALAAARTAPRPSPLILEATIPLPEVQGRMDHLALDVSGQRLFVAALGNNTVEVIDLKANRRLTTIQGIKEPQGILYLPRAGQLYVTSGADGTLRSFDGATLQPRQTIPYGQDADNIRYDSERDRIYVAYGNGTLGELTPDGKRLAEIPLEGHPESFQLEKNGGRAFVNLPNAKAILVIDRETRTIVSQWKTGGPEANFPMALDESRRRLFIVCREPARLIVLDTRNGRRVASMPTVGDADDVFYDADNRRLYTIGGHGTVWVHEQKDADHYRKLAEITTVPGARTGLFSPELKRLYVAVRRQEGHQAEVRVYRIEP